MDLEAVARDLGLERHEFLELVTIFLEASSSDLATLEAALGQEDLGEATAAAHSLKGAALNLGFQEIAHLARLLEMTAKDATLTGASGQLAALKEKLLELDRAVSPPRPY